MKTTIKNENFITIQGFMRNELDLKGNELLVYAIIYGFSQDNESWFTGSHQYMSEWVGITRRGIINILNKLLESEVIIKEDVYINNIKFCKYRANLEMLETSQGMKKVHRGYEKSSHNNIEDNKENIIDKSIIQKKVKKFTKPSIEELKEYCKYLNYPDYSEAFYDFYESKDWYVGKNKMKCWKSGIRNWNRNNRNKVVERSSSYDGLKEL